ncbi:FkbM family methyltransferase [Myxococcota bacterium]
MARIDLIANGSFARVLRDFPIAAADIGSRYGFDTDLEPIASAVDFVGFEPDPAEFERLERASRSFPRIWRSQRYIGSALSGTGGRRKLSIPRVAESTSLLEHDIDIGNEFGHRAMFEVAQVLEVDTITLDAALQVHHIAAIQYIKIDIEGAELEVLAAAPIALEQVLAIKTEVSFIPMRKRQPLAGDIDAFLRERGFILMDFRAPAHWRRSSRVVHPQLARDGIPYSRGQLAQGDYLYFRDPGRIPSEDFPASIRAAALAMTFGFFDHANVLLGRPAVAERLRHGYGIEPELCVREASLAFGRRVWAGEFITHLRRIVTYLRSARTAALG